MFLEPWMSLLGEPPSWPNTENPPTKTMVVYKLLVSLDDFPESWKLRSCQVEMRRSPRPSPKPSSKAEASRQEVALPSRAVKLRSDGTCSSTIVLSNPVGGGGLRAPRVLDTKTGA